IKQEVSQRQDRKEEIVEATTLPEDRTIKEEEVDEVPVNDSFCHCLNTYSTFDSPSFVRSLSLSIVFLFFQVFHKNDFLWP
ncbi:MAG: hypothetical protein ACKOKF_04675, partial [Bacteroidota bacterium]